MGRLSELIERRFGVSTRTESDPVTRTVGTTSELIARANPDRLSLTIINLDSDDLWVLFDQLVSTTRGVFVPALGGSVSVSPEEDFETVGYAWYGISDVASTNITVIEVIGL